MTGKQFLKPHMLHRANTTEQWLSTDTDKNWNKTYKSKKTTYRPEDFNYQFNNRGFRCDDFESWELYPERVLFAGCSFTEGVGLPFEVVWSKLYHNEICKQLGKDIPYWNIGVSGSGIDHLSRNLYVEGNILQPNVVIAFYPFLSRFERWDKDFLLVQTIEHETDNAFFKEEYLFYQLEKNFAFINLLLEKWNSRLILYTNLDQIDICTNYDNIDFINFSYDDNHTFDYARDGCHFGIQTQENLYSKIFDLSWPIVKNKIGL